MNEKSVREILDEAIDIIDKLETFLSRITPGSKIEKGLVFQLYQNLLLLREKIIEARMKS